MLPIAFWGAVLLLLCGMMACAADEGQGVSLVNRVRAGHPRLILLDERLPALRQSIKDDATLAEWYRQVRASAVQLLEAPCIAYQRDKRANMLEDARAAVDRIYRLGLVYRIEGEPAMAARAIQELMHAAALKDWDPKHFLDTAELTHAVAIGYDWFFPVLSPEQRTVVRAALCRNGLEEGVYFYTAGWPITARYWDFNWSVCNFNWNQVCNGGMSIGALAVADEAPALAGRILSGALKSIRQAMAEFAPDGGWIEGPGYWEYATSYNTYFLAALDSAIGPDVIAPYLRMPGFDKTGDFRLHVTGPLNRTFNFGDSRDRVDRSSQLFWMAEKFKRPEYAWYAKQAVASQPAPLDIVWYSPHQTDPQTAGMPLDACFRHVAMAFMRGAWNDPLAAYVGFKGGNNQANHTHLDLGSFVYDADGCRWAMDLGRDDYALPFYFEFGKIRYYRLKTVGHNTLVFEGKNQCPTAEAPIISFHTEPERAFAVADLSQAYRMKPGQVLRGVALLHRRNLVLRDDFAMTASAEVAWQMHTQADIAVQGARAVLRQNNKTLTVTIVEPEGAVFEVQTAHSPPPESQQPEVSKVVIRLSLPAGKTRLTVTLCPGEAPDIPEVTDNTFEVPTVIQ